MLHKLFFYILFCLLFLECSKYEATPPSYIKINEFKVSDAKITDAWIYINNEFIGAYELPCEIPVSNQGSVKVTVAPGIKNTGQSSLREKYIFYQWFDTIITLNYKSYLIEPHSIYINNKNNLWLGDFENNINWFNKESNSDTNLYITNSNAFLGSACGEITVNNSNPFARVKSNTGLDIPPAGKRTFLEMNYACNAPVKIGVLCTMGTSVFDTPIITLSSTQLLWNKIYIDLSNTLNTMNSQGKFEIYCEIQQISGEENKFRTDNLKIISQQ